MSHGDPWAQDNWQWVLSNQPKGTTDAYASAWRGFVSFCLAHNRACLPAAPATVGMYLRTLQVAGKARSTINKTTVSAIKRYHEIYGFAPPTGGADIKLIKRVVTKLTPPPTPKLPLEKVHLKRMTQIAQNNFIDQRDVFMLKLMFLGLLRESEVVALKFTDVVLHQQDKGTYYLSVFVETSKTDQGSFGEIVVIEQAEDPLICIVRAYCSYVQLRSAGATYLIHQALGSTQNKMASRTANDRIHVWLQRIGVNSSPYGSHSCRRGGATAAANAGVVERLLQKHGRWASTCVRMYIADDLLQRLKVSRAIHSA